MDPDGSSNLFGYIILLFVLILCNAFFSMSEMAIVSLNDNKVRRMAQDGDKKALRLEKLIDNPTDFLSTIQIGVTLSGFLASAVAADTFVEMLVNSLGSKLAISASSFRMISLFLITAVLSFITLVLGELVPKRIAMHNYEKISFAVVGVLTGLLTVIRPLVSLVSMTTNGILRLIGIDPNNQPEEVTEEEIRMMLDVGRESGHIHESDRDMIDNIFEFDDRYVEDIMTHRTEVVAIDTKTELEELLNLAVETGYSRLPVYEDDLDDIIGVLYVKDLLEFAVSKNKPFNILNFLREPMFVIETTTCKALLEKFQETKIQMAIVVDEYGGTAGLVSMEDLLESIVGNIQDEYDDEEEEISPLGENSYIVDGLTPLEDVFRFFGISDLDNEDDFDTIGGYVLSQIGQIPGEHERPTVKIGEILFTIKEMDERRIAKLLAEIAAEEELLEELEEIPEGIKEKGIRRGKDKDKNKA